ncbi:MAG: uroporphyrinogen decarboxylase, partial [Campylobacteraceae bacterium]|nr:uroporphyrinogen decarboxylase [Campylobacteraceae bacterium]
LHEILAKVTEVLKLFLERQIQSGVNAVQIFDSWASALEENAFFEFSWRYIKELCTYLKSKYPHIPIIVFPKGISGYLDKIEGDFDVFGVDWSTPIELAKEKLGHKYVLQGNMEPARLYDKNAVKDSVEHIIKIMGTKRHIFNLGHGILPDIPVQNAKYFVDLVHSLTKK